MINRHALAAAPRHFWLGPALVVALGIMIVAWFVPTMSIERVPWVWSTKFSIWRVVSGLYADGQYFIGAVIFLFSMVFPAAKLLAGLWVWAWVDAESGNARRAVGVVHALGKWSMLDVFLVALVVAAVQMSWLINNVEVHYGIYLFTAAIVLSIVLMHFVEKALAPARLEL